MAILREAINIEFKNEKDRDRNERNSYKNRFFTMAVQEKCCVFVSGLKIHNRRKYVFVP